MDMLRSLTHRIGSLVCTASVVVLIFFGGSRAWADSEPASKSPSVDLAMKQSQLADRYRRLETLMLKMAEYDASNNPRRAALLKQALAKGKEQRIGTQLDALVRLFQQEQLQQAVDDQGAVRADLQVLLDLLLSENRPDRLKTEQARVRNYIKQLDRIIRQQKSVKGRTEAGERGDRLAKDQGQIADRTQSLGAEIDQAESTPTPSGDAQQAGDGAEQSQRADDSSQKDDPPKDADSSSDRQPGDGQNNDGDQKADQSPPADSQPESGKPARPPSGSGDSQQGSSPESSPPSSQQSPPSQPGQPGAPPSGSPSDAEPGTPSNEQQQAQPYPGRKRIQAAEDHMRQARQRLEKAKRDEAVQEQQEAQQLLEQAKAELEQILRQLREEEIERVLAMLEGRFRKMLEMELKIQSETVRLAKTPATKRTRQFSIRVGKLSLDQRKVVLEVDKALTLLREEGSSVAFPEAVMQLRTDMEAIATRLGDEKVGEVTQALEDDVVAALEEMIGALQKAQQEAEQRRNQAQPPPGASGDPSDQPLVDKIAELKMIRALQVRVNTRTQRFAKLLGDTDDPVGQATDDDLVQAIQDLSERQQRIQKVTSDIVLGKNQ